MATEVREVSGFAFKTLATLDTFEAAKDYVNGLDPLLVEDDKDYPGCADAFLKDGRVVAIQPVGFKI
jgi:hypothetical protein